MGPTAASGYLSVLLAYALVLGAVLGAARRLLRAGQPAQALETAREAARLRPGRSYYQLLLGDALAANGRRVGARRAWRRALRLRPGSAAATRRLGRGSRPVSPLATRIARPGPS